MINSSYRDLSWDILRGILILLVVVGHSVQDLQLRTSYDSSLYATIYNAIYLFHMPLFVFVSGYFSYSMTKRTFNETMKIKVKRLVIPWLVWSSFVMLVSLQSLNCNFISIGQATYRIYAHYYWFLPCVFILSLSYYSILNFKKKMKWKILSVMILMIWVLSLIFNSRIPFNYLEYMQISRQAIPFGLGLLYFKYRNALKRSTKTFIFSTAVLGMLLGFYHYGIWQNNYTILEKISNGSMMTIVTFCVLNFFCNKVPDLSLVGKSLCWCGQNSLGIYVVHMFLRIIYKRFQIFNNSVNDFSFVFLAASYLGVSLIIILGVKMVFRQKSYVLGI